jgi:toxin ParE1/3/4
VSRPVARHPAVEDDILDIAKWIAHDSAQAARRFLAAVEESIAGLRLFPNKGSPKQFRANALAGVRSWRVRGFPKHLIFYVVRPDDVYVLAVLHGARNTARHLRGRA